MNIKAGLPHTDQIHVLILMNSKFRETPSSAGLGPEHHMTRPPRNPPIVTLLKVNSHWLRKEVKSCTPSGKIHSEIPFVFF